jgi:predicted esterase
MKRGDAPALVRAWSLRRSASRVAVALAVSALAVVLYVRRSPRPQHLPLATSIDGPTPAHAAGVLVYLHGRGSGLGRAERIVARLREAGLPPDFTIVSLEGPFSSGFGHAWGDTAEEQAASRSRVRSRLKDLLGDGGPRHDRVVIAGFSQGAGVAIDTAIEEPRIGAVASFSPCLSMLRGALPKRDDLRILLAHGAHDTQCPVEESRSLARVLEVAHKPAQYIEFDGGHVVPAEVVRALAAFATVP